MIGLWVAELPVALGAAPGDSGAWPRVHIADGDDLPPVLAHGGERVGVGDDVGAQGAELVALPKQHLVWVAAGWERGGVRDIGNVLLVSEDQWPVQKCWLLDCSQADLTRNVTPAKMTARIIILIIKRNFHSRFINWTWLTIKGRGKLEHEVNKCLFYLWEEEGRKYRERLAIIFSYCPLNFSWSIKITIYLTKLKVYLWFSGSREICGVL